MWGRKLYTVSTQGSHICSRSLCNWKFSKYSISPLVLLSVFTCASCLLNITCKLYCQLWLRSQAPPSFPSLAVRKSGERVWYLFSREHDVIRKWQKFAKLTGCISQIFTGSLLLYRTASDGKLGGAWERNSPAQVSQMKSWHAMNSGLITCIQSNFMAPS